jgi:hypothetical protein
MFIQPLSWFTGLGQSHGLRDLGHGLHVWLGCPHHIRVQKGEIILYSHLGMHKTGFGKKLQFLWEKWHRHNAFTYEKGIGPY